MPSSCKSNYKILLLLQLYTDYLCDESFKNDTNELEYASALMYNLSSINAGQKNPVSNSVISESTVVLSM